MAFRHTAADQSQPSIDSRRDEVARWVRAVHRLPVVRVETVVAVRDALRRHRYDNERVLTETIERLSDDVGILCRREFKHKST